MNTPERKAPTEATQNVLSAHVGSLPFEDTSDFERASRGLIADGPRQILGSLGHAVWNRDDYVFQGSPTSASVHPSLWRQAQLNNIAGLFQVCEGVYQVRGLDISNITFIEGETGWIVIDPLTGEETARASYELVSEHLGHRPIKAVIYTHSHTDHFGGVRGVVDEADVVSGKIPVIAPEGFTESAISENVIAGTAMIRRSMYMYGVLLPKDELGHVDTGLGKTLPAMPTVWFVLPTLIIRESRERHVIDGVTLEFQLTPGTEAPAEMNIFLPERRALCLAENCTANLHNLYTLRGAQARDALGWSKYIQECLEVYLDETDVTFASHHWPRWGRDDIETYLRDQRDLYRCIHDQTMRMANLGMTMNEIAEEIALPAHLSQRFYNRDYYGTIRHNAKAVYQRYLGWFDANPAHLNPHTPEQAGRRYVELAGGADALLEKARRAFAEGDYRWVAEIVNHLVFADPTNEAARYLQADALEQLGYQSESGPWRDFYLTGAMELRSNGTILKGVRANANGPAFTRAMPLEQLSDVLGVRLHALRASSLFMTLGVSISDRPSPDHFIEIRGGVLSSRPLRSGEECSVSIVATQEAFALFCGGLISIADLEARGDFVVEGRRADLDAMVAAMDVFEFGFEIVLP